MKIINANMLKRQAQKDPQFAQLIHDGTTGNALRIRAKANGKDAVVLIDTGNDMGTAVAQRFVDEHKIPTYDIKPIRVDLAGTGIKQQLNRAADITLQFTTPLTGTTHQQTIRAIVFPTNRDDIIVGIHDITKHLVPLVTEILLAARTHTHSL